MSQIILSGMELKEFLSSIREIFQEEISNCKTVSLPKNTSINSIGGIELAQRITGLARSTIYNLVSQHKIPFCKPKNSGKLYFVESDLRAWIQEGRRQTTDEVAQEVQTFLANSTKFDIRRNKSQG
ncbi:helix-turn-helix transcriptional regulator [Spirosoma spitsbergense]|uniref:helix-turn-helix transcriptional regulator n=1 Tax=Spirosoma spitsbergense TaxID=431554 RepID=UPI000360B128|nr:helix-turn-helix domain-containing protein [Spirosoma spitsbergense]